MSRFLTLMVVTSWTITGCSTGGPALAAAPSPSSPAPVRGADRMGSLQVGDQAPDAALVRVDGSSTTLLAARRAGRPLVLIFGSFT